MTASRSLVRLPSTATLLPEEAGRWDADCQTATTYIGGSGSGSRPGRWVCPQSGVTDAWCERCRLIVRHHVEEWSVTVPSCPDHGRMVRA